MLSERVQVDLVRVVVVIVGVTVFMSIVAPEILHEGMRGIKEIFTILGE